MVHSFFLDIFLNSIIYQVYDRCNGKNHIPLKYCLNQDFQDLRIFRIKRYGSFIYVYDSCNGKNPIHFFSHDAKPFKSS